MRAKENPQAEAQVDQAESYRYSQSELNLMDEIPRPRLNPWICLFLLILLGFLYVWFWKWLLGG